MPVFLVFCLLCKAQQSVDDIQCFVSNLLRFPSSKSSIFLSQLTLLYVAIFVHMHNMNIAMQFSVFNTASVASYVQFFLSAYLQFVVHAHWFCTFSEVYKFRFSISSVFITQVPKVRRALLFIHKHHTIVFFTLREKPFVTAAVAIHWIFSN